MNLISKNTTAAALVHNKSAAVSTCARAVLEVNGNAIPSP